jgi:retinol-binding protein 3
MQKNKSILVLVLIMFIGAAVYAQNKKQVTLDPQTKTQTVEKISKLLDDNYIFPETAKKMGEFIKSQLKGGVYESINDPMAFSETLTRDLQSISKDKHINVRFNPDEAEALIKAASNGNGPNAEDEKRWNEMLKKDNYGFKKVEILKGNIGYVNITNFAAPDYSKETITAVMSFLQNSSALIFDMRQNGGGDPRGVQLLCSYLFRDTPVHLNDLYFRPEDKTDEFWTLRTVDGKRMPDVPVYVLTSRYTFSGAEEFTYNLKNLKRATIVGETTGGGAHPGDVMPINSSFMIFVPNGRAISPITKTNWEGTGVIPDVSISSEKALEQAQILALENLAANTKDEQVKSSYKWMIESLQATMNTPTIDETTLKSYAGTYGERTVSFENGKLYYQRTGRPRMQMIPMTEDTFMFSDVGYFRVKFVKDSNGVVTELNGLYDDGRIDKTPKTN